VTHEKDIAAYDFDRMLEHLNLNYPRIYKTLVEFHGYAKAAALVEIMTGGDRTSGFNALVAASK
jgi:hypothetical protein